MNQSLVADLLRRYGFHGPFILTQLPGGANNRVFRIDAETGPLLLKSYFNHPNDPRNRAETEFDFTQFAWDCGLRCVPQPLACDSNSQMAVYRFIAGRRVVSGDINQDLVGQALTFYKTLNLHKDGLEARSLPIASEACFDLSSHMKSIAGRIVRLRQLRSTSSIDRQAQDFVRDSLLPLWAAVEERFYDEATASGIATTTEIAQADRRISPSDFGFHNALLADSGQLFFLDFEYAGWDDPAKLVCDFLCQPAIPLPEKYRDSFGKAVMSDLTRRDYHLKRAALLLPAYQVKWICIMLNDFLPAANERRRFADNRSEDNDRKTRQLHQAMTYLNKIEVGA
jgi:thiamine kinase-like enzyme